MFNPIIIGVNSTQPPSTDRCTIDKTWPCRTTLCVWLLLAVSIGLLYLQAIDAPFVLDDHYQISDIASQSDSPLLETSLYRNPRALPLITLRINHSWTGLDTWSYHLVNFLCHLLNAILLYHLCRQTLAVATKQSAGSCHFLAAIIAWLWAVHPLASQPVIYIVQRSELMASGMYLLSLYALTMTASREKQTRPWQALVVLSCVAGLYCKPIAATIPLAALLWDRTFLAGSFLAALKERWHLYAMLVASLSILFITGVLGLLNTSDPIGANLSAGVSVETITPLAYLFVQSRIILHYLWLCVWPMQLVFDYGWPPPAHLSDHALSFVIVTVIFLLTAFSLATRYARHGMLMMLFFLILAPTSSILPIYDLAVEHRMYLPLACVIALLVMAMYPFFKQRRIWGMMLLAIVGLLLAGRCYLRVSDYRDSQTLWKSVIRAVPYQPRAYYYLGDALETADDKEQAMLAYQRAISFADEKPTQVNFVSHLRLGALTLQAGEPQQAIELLHQAQTMTSPDDVSVSNLLILAYRQQAALYARQRQWAKAVESFEKVRSLSPEDSGFLRVYAWLLATCPDASIRDGQRAIQLLDQAPDNDGSHALENIDIRAAAMAATGRFDEALKIADIGIKQAQEHNNTSMLKRIEEHRAFYANKQPFLLQ